jgi:bacterioferritin-associated ferredoxin
MLKKEFKRKDVDRARNILTGKSGASSETQVGYKKKRVDYKEGDVWVENKKTWTIKDGIKQTISKMDKIKKEIFMPLCCPKCSKVMKKRLDKPNYKIHKMCFNCVIDYEGKLRIRGEYEDYIKNLRLKNRLTEIDEIENMFLELANQSNEGFISEHGELERWKGGVDMSKMSAAISEAAQKGREAVKKELTNEED